MDRAIFLLPYLYSLSAFYFLFSLINFELLLQGNPEKEKRNNSQFDRKSGNKKGDEKEYRERDNSHSHSNRTKYQNSNYNKQNNSGNKSQHHSSDYKAPRDSKRSYERERSPPKRKLKLPYNLQCQFDEIVNSLTLSRQNILMAMGFVMENSEYAAEVYFFIESCRSSFLTSQNSFVKLLQQR